MSSLREDLVQTLQARLVPRLLETGFRPFGLSKAELSEKDFATAFPLGFYRRPSDGGYDLIDIQFDPRGEARFTINAAQIESGGVHLPWGKTINVECAHATDAMHYVRLIDGTIRKRWFGARLFARESSVEAKPIVDRALEKYSQIEEWFRSGDVGGNLEIRTIR